MFSLLKRSQRRVRRFKKDIIKHHKGMKTKTELKKQIEAKNKTLHRYIRIIQYTWTETTFKNMVERRAKSYNEQDRKVQTLFFPLLSWQGINRYYLKLGEN